MCGLLLGRRDRVVVNICRIRTHASEMRIMSGRLWRVKLVLLWGLLRLAQSVCLTTMTSGGIFSWSSSLVLAKCGFIGMWSTYHRDWNRPSHNSPPCAGTVFPCVCPAAINCWFLDMGLNGLSDSRWLVLILVILVCVWRAEKSGFSANGFNSIEW